MAAVTEVGTRGDVLSVSSDAVDGVLRRGEVNIAWQPIVSLLDGRVLGYEALARFPGAELVSPAEWFRAAAAYGVGLELEALAIEVAVRQLGRLPADVFISLNISPLGAASARIRRTLASLPTDRVVLEISEHDATEVADELGVALDELRASGVRLAIDDAGSGPASLRQLLGIHPDIIKIDTQVTRGIDADPTKQAIASALRSLATRSGAMSLAEGVETEEEAATLVDLEIDAAQGYLWGRPEPLT